MDASKRAPEYTVDVLTDPACAKDIVKGILHTIFFHRTFTAIRPLTRDILDTTLPLVDDPDLETLIDQRVTTLIRRLESAVTSNNGPPVGPPHCPLHITFHELRRRNSKKPTSYFASAFGAALGGGRAATSEEEVCWESWNVVVSMQRARTEGEAKRLMERMESSLREAALKVMENASSEKGHIPPIMTAETNPFPYRVVIGEVVWGGTR